MENMDKKECGDVCKNSSCSGCCGGMGCMHGMHGCCGRKRHLLKIILKIVIVIIIFSCGFKLGEMTGIIRAEYGRVNNFGMMRYTNLPVNGVQVPAQ